LFLSSGRICLERRRCRTVRIQSRSIGSCSQIIRLRHFGGGSKLEESALGALACHVWQPCNPKSSGEGATQRVGDSTTRNSSWSILRSTSCRDSLVYKKKSVPKLPISGRSKFSSSPPRTARRQNNLLIESCKWHRRGKGLSTVGVSGGLD
jgi:hypothetical protein